MDLPEQNKFWLSNEDFDYIYSKVPRLNVDLIIHAPEGILFSQRTIEPNKGMWHFPGGTVYKTERITDAALRIAKKETGLTVTYKNLVGYMEFPSEWRGKIEVHTISLAIEVTPVEGELKLSTDASALKFLKEIPEFCIQEHEALLKEKGLL